MNKKLDNDIKELEQLKSELNDLGSLGEVRKNIIEQKKVEMQLQFKKDILKIINKYPSLILKNAWLIDFDKTLRDVITERNDWGNV